MLASALIRELQNEISVNGDFEVHLYTLQPEAEFTVSAVEYNDDGDEPVILIEGEPVH